MPIQLDCLQRRLFDPPPTIFRPCDAPPTDLALFRQPVAYIQQKAIDAQRMGSSVYPTHRACPTVHCAWRSWYWRMRRPRMQESLQIETVEVSTRDGARGYDDQLGGEWIRD